MPNTTSCLIGAAVIFAIMWVLQNRKEPFAVQTIPTADPYTPFPIALGENKLETELASAIDQDAPQLSKAVGVSVGTVDTCESNDIVKAVLGRLNSHTDFNLHLIDITNASKQVDRNGIKYISLIFKAHDQSRVFLREIAADFVVLPTGRLYVSNIFFTNCSKTPSDVQGISSIDSLQTYAPFPSPLSDEW